MKTPQWSGGASPETWLDRVLPLIAERYQEEAQVRTTLKSTAAKRFFMEGNNFRTIPEEIIKSLCRQVAEEISSPDFKDAEANFWLARKYASSRAETDWFIQYLLDELIDLYLREGDWERPRIRVLEEWDPGETQCRARWNYDLDGNIQSMEELVLPPPPASLPTANTPRLQDDSLMEGQPWQVSAIILSPQRIPLYRTVNPGILRRESEYKPLLWHGTGRETVVAVYRSELYPPAG